VALMKRNYFIVADLFDLEIDETGATHVKSR
jgi:hypothetical protein